MAQDARTFMEYCKTGNIDNIKKMSLNKCDLTGGFRRACYNGHYVIVKYLVELYKNNETGNPKYNMIDIHSCNEAGFIMACYNGHYMVIKYLVELYKTENSNDKFFNKIDIHYNNESGFIWAYYNGHYMIVKYLMTLHKKHKYIPFNNYLIIFKKIDKYKL